MLRSYEMGNMFGGASEALSNMGSGLSKAASSAGDWFGNMGDKAMGLANDTQDYFTMSQDRDSFIKSQVPTDLGQWKDVKTGRKLTKDQMEALKLDMEKAAGADWDSENRDKKLRRQIAGGLLGGIAGGLMHNDGQTAPSLVRGSSGSASGGGKLGTGYNPFK